MDFKRFHKTKFLIGLALALIVLGLALHQHDPSHFTDGHSCVICLSILHWAPAAFVAFVLLVFHHHSIIRIPSLTCPRRTPDFTRPPLRAPPQIGP